jgi:hypothetical protein
MTAEPFSRRAMLEGFRDQIPRLRSIPCFKNLHILNVLANYKERAKNPGLCKLFTPPGRRRLSPVFTYGSECRSAFLRNRVQLRLISRAWPSVPAPRRRRRTERDRH